MTEAFDDGRGLISFRGWWVPAHWPQLLERSQHTRTLLIDGQYVPRLKFGRESEAIRRAEWPECDAASLESGCPACLAWHDEFHVEACPREQCPRCGGRLAECDHRFRSSRVGGVLQRLLGVTLIVAGFVEIFSSGGGSTSGGDQLISTLIGSVLISLGVRGVFPPSRFGALPILCRKLPLSSSLCVLGAVVLGLTALSSVDAAARLHEWMSALLRGAALLLLISMVLHVAHHHRVGIRFRRAEPLSPDEKPSDS